MRPGGRACPPGLVLATAQSLVALAGSTITGTIPATPCTARVMEAAMIATEARPGSGASVRTSLPTDP